MGKLRTRSGTREYQAQPECLFRGWPLAAVIDDRTSAAAEWLVAALQDRRRAKVFGTNSAAHGFVKSLVPVAGRDESVMLATGVLLRIDGAVLLPGASAPKLVSRKMLSNMKRNAVLVDVAIDQGGCFETSKPTTHSAPTYEVDGIIHYCVANMPGAVPKTSTYALNNVTLPFTLALADKGWKQALSDDPHLMNGLNVHAGKITYEAVAKDLGYDFVDPAKAISA